MCKDHGLREGAGGSKREGQDGRDRTGCSGCEMSEDQGERGQRIKARWLGRVRSEGQGARQASRCQKVWARSRQGPGYHAERMGQGPRVGVRGQRVRARGSE